MKKLTDLEKRRLELVIENTRNKEDIYFWLVTTIIITLIIFSAIKISHAFNESYNEKIKAYCILSLLLDINKNNDYLHLCSDKNCIDYFKQKIDFDIKMVNECER